MGRNRKYTEEFYTDAAMAAVNRMGEDGYTKDQILDLAGFESGQRQHWRNLRVAFSRIGVTLCHVSGKGWTKGSVSDTGNIIEMHHKLIERIVRSQRPEVVAHLQNAQTAEEAVAYLTNQGLDPLTFVDACSHANDPLPLEAEEELIRATRRLLPGMPLEMQRRIGQASDHRLRIAGLLAAPVDG